jgi:drug/metabolite transporter (DMT)-like permease
MNRKRIVGLIVFVVGLFLIIFSIHAMEKAPQPSGVGHSVSNFFRHNPMWNPLITFFGGTPQTKLVEHHPSHTWSLITGTLLVIVGGLLAFMRKGKRKKR